MTDDLPELEWPRFSVLEGRWAREWAAAGLGDSRVAFVARPAVPAKPDEPRHYCGCGIKQRYCAPCDVWVCDAPGHIKHVCSGAT